MKISMVVFDMAGTTVDEDNVVYKTLQKALVKFEVNATLNQVLLYGAGKEKYQAIKDIVTSLQIELNEIVLKQIFEYFLTELSNAYMSFEVKEMPNALSTFKALRSRRIKVVLNTGYNRQTAQGLIDKIGWVQNIDFDLLVTASDVSNNRPNPDMIFLAMQEFHINPEDGVIKVGDSCVDIEEGQNANCTYTIGITTGAQTSEQLKTSQPNFIIDDLKDLLELI